ncbi:hypothetical protein [Sedimentitalea todarodis]|uniref:Uncharacterized protein n=1 Tax=Sedimentitalea todarodis TaxID=1631240 RepID=A0ABU3VEA4_9RHOB|nr:hypothetical protein [Sedimentitalea todarodis]MDU9004519.1 hypothetical protein [Sedimentitalea todarodis]
MRYLIAVLTLYATQLSAHEMQDNFANKKCGETLALIDSPEMGDKSVKTLVASAGAMAMAFGYMLGFEAASGRELRGSSETLLTRLRNDCARSPDKTALELLSGY